MHVCVCVCVCVSKEIQAAKTEDRSRISFVQNIRINFCRSGAFYFYVFGIEFSRSSSFFAFHYPTRHILRT